MYHLLVVIAERHSTDEKVVAKKSTSVVVVSGSVVSIPMFANTMNLSVRFAVDTMDCTVAGIEIPVLTGLGNDSLLVVMSLTQYS